MAKLSPLQQVREDHGSKEALAKKVLEVLTASEDADAEAFEHKVKTMSNKKLLRLWKTHEHVQATYGSKDALVDTIVKARFPGGNAPYAAKLKTFHLPKLVDLARQHGV